MRYLIVLLGLVPAYGQLQSGGRAATVVTPAAVTGARICTISSSSATAYVGATSPAMSTYPAGVEVRFTANQTSGAAPTLNCGGGAMAIRDALASEAIPTGFMESGYVYTVRSNGTYWLMQEPAPGATGQKFLSNVSVGTNAPPAGALPNSLVVSGSTFGPPLISPVSRAASWDFIQNAASATTLYDTAGASYASNGTSMNGVITGATFSSTGLDFNGSTNYVEFPVTAALGLVSTFSVAVAARLNSNASSASYTLYEKNGSHFTVYLDADGVALLRFQEGATSTVATSLFRISRNTWHTFAVTSAGTSAGQTKLFVDGISCGNGLAVAANATNDAAAHIGSFSNYAFFWPGSIGYAVKWSRALTDAEVMSAHRAMQDIMVTRSVTISANPFVVFDGDSLSTAIGDVADVDSYPAKTAVLLNTALKPVTYVMTGVGGYRTTDLAANGAVTDGYYNDTLAKNIISAWIGSNDLAGGASSVELQYRIKAYVAARKARGFKVAVYTILPRQPSGIAAGFETQRLLYNTWLRANWSTFADAFGDPAADTRIGDTGDYSDLTYYQSDQVHLNAVGFAIQAALASTAIQALL